MGPRIRAGSLLAIAIVVVSAAAAAAQPPQGQPIGIAVLRPPPGSAAFPVRGAVSYGQGAAHYGADRGGRMHEGQDLFAPAGTPLRAVRDVAVLEAGDDGGRGNYVALFSRAANETYVYMHMREPARVKPGQHVGAGRTVGELGCTGSCWGPHLHFELRLGRGAQAPPVDPNPLLGWLTATG